jgi:DNA-binding transcriptional MocR family regulator
MTIFKYEEIFAHFVDAIESDTILHGEKLSSLRNSANYFSCSISVIKQAYEELECQGYIYSVEKSGFYVNYRKTEVLPEPQNYDHKLIATATKASNMINQIMEMAHMPHIIPFGAAIPDLSLLAGKKISSVISKNVKSNLNLINSYAATDGELCLRKEIAKYMYKKGVNINASEIIITNGCSEALFLAVKSCSEPGDTFVIETPTYLGLVTILETLKRKVIEVPTSPEKGIDLDILEKILETEKIQALVVNPVFQNPLGFSMSDSDKSRLYSLADLYSLTIIEDDIYSDCSFSNRILKPIKALDLSGRVIYCSSFSKTLAPGLRIGWTIAGKYFKKVSLERQLSGLGGPVLIEISVAEYLNSGAYEYHLKYFRKKIANQVYEIRKLINIHFPEHTRISTPEGGYFLWVELPQILNSIELYNWAFKNNIGIIPGTVFSASGKYLNCIRISCGSPVTEKIIEGIERLGFYLCNLI